MAFYRPCSRGWNIKPRVAQGPALIQLTVGFRAEPAIQPWTAGLDACRIAEVLCSFGRCNLKPSLLVRLGSAVPSVRRLVTFTKDTTHIASRLLNRVSLHHIKMYPILFTNSNVFICHFCLKLAFIVSPAGYLSLGRVWLTPGKLPLQAKASTGSFIVVLFLQAIVHSTTEYTHWRASSRSQMEWDLAGFTTHFSLTLASSHSAASHKIFEF